MNTESTSVSEQGAQISPFEFHGVGSEFFKIWIVNIILTVLTLGIYSAWAKVRTKRYFYTNTKVMGSSFDYIATPIQILKGRIIAFTVLLLFVLATNLSPMMGLILPLVLFALMPIIIVLSTRFNARYSTFRNVRFNFVGSIGKAYVVMALLPLVPFIVLFAPGGYIQYQAFLGNEPELALLGLLFLLAVLAGLAMGPYVFYKQKQFFVENHKFGKQLFNLDLGPKDFFILVFKIIGVNIAIVVAIVIGFAISVLIGAIGGDVLSAILMAATYIAGFGALVALTQIMTYNLIYNAVQLGSNHTKGNYGYYAYVELVVVNTILTAITLGLFYPFAKVRTAKYMADHMSFVHDESFERIEAEAIKEQNSILEEMGDAFDLELGI